MLSSKGWKVSRIIPVFHRISTCAAYAALKAQAYSPMQAKLTRTPFAEFVCLFFWWALPLLTLSTTLKNQISVYFHIFQCCSTPMACISQNLTEPAPIFQGAAFSARRRSSSWMLQMMAMWSPLPPRWVRWTVWQFGEDWWRFAQLEQLTVGYCQTRLTCALSVRTKFFGCLFRLMMQRLEWYEIHIARHFKAFLQTGAPCTKLECEWYLFNDYSLQFASILQQAEQLKRQTQLGEWWLGLAA